MSIFPKVGYVMSLGGCDPASTYFHHNMPGQNANRVWAFGSGIKDAQGKVAPGSLPPPLFKIRYGEPVLTRIYNNLPTDRADNGGFGRNEHQLHFHNAHNGAESDGAANVHHFPGTFYDYRWSTTLARRDTINTAGTENRASGPDGNGGVINVKGDFRELQGSMWAHDHRFFFTAENVYKGMLSVVNYYSGPDRGNEVIPGGTYTSSTGPKPINLRLPSGNQLDWGNVDFDVNLVISDCATDPDGQMFFDIFNTDGFLGDIPLVNFSYAPYFNVLPRKYRFRILPASMSRFWKFGLFRSNGTPMAIKQIANDGNLLVNPVLVTALDIQGIAERFDIVVDFSSVPVGQKIRLANMLQMRDDGRGPQAVLSYANALAYNATDPVVGDIMEFRVVSSVPSVDNPPIPGVPGSGWTHTIANACGVNDKSQVPLILTEQIPIVPPVRTRVVEFGRSGGGDSRGADGKCVPDCPETASFPWTIKINGQAAHSMNANRVSLVTKPGEVEHWTYVNGGGGWDHPIHLHFEEGVTMNRGTAPIPATEKNVRKDVWRLGSGGRVQFQVQFGEFGGSYVNHCHNTVHEDFAMLMRIQLLNGISDAALASVTDTPNPTPDGVVFTTPEILPEGNPFGPQG